MSADDFFSIVKPTRQAILHDALMSGRQIFYINAIGGWEAYPNYELDAPKGYWWMDLAQIKSTLEISLLTPNCRIPTSIEKRLAVNESPS